MAIDFREVIAKLMDIGFYDIFLPFILIYSVVFAILEKSRIFEKNEDDKTSRSVNSIVAFVFGLFVVASYTTVRYIQDVITNVVVFLIFLLVVLIALGFVFGRDFFKHVFHDKDGNPHKGIIWTVSVLIFLVCLGVLFSVVGVWEWLDKHDLEIPFDGGDVWSVVVFLMFIAVLVWITNGGDSSKKSE